MGPKWGLCRCNSTNRTLTYYIDMQFLRIILACVPIEGKC